MELSAEESVDLIKACLTQALQRSDAKTFMLSLGGLFAGLATNGSGILTEAQAAQANLMLRRVCEAAELGWL